MKAHNPINRGDGQPSLYPAVTRAALEDALAVSVASIILLLDIVDRTDIVATLSGDEAAAFGVVRMNVEVFAPLTFPGVPPSSQSDQSPLRLVQGDEE